MDKQQEEELIARLTVDSDNLHPMLCNLFNTMRAIDDSGPVSGKNTAFTLICYDEKDEAVMVMGSHVHLTGEGDQFPKNDRLSVLCDWPIAAAASHIGVSLFMNDYIEHVRGLVKIRQRIESVGGVEIARELMDKSTSMDDFKAHLAILEERTERLRKADPASLFTA